MKPPVMLCVTSGKGGVGKTSLTVNMAFALSRQGHRVLIVDGDLGLANIDVLLALNVKQTIRDVLERGGDPMEAVVYVEPNLGILPASSGVPEMVALGPDDQQQLGDILGSISTHFDYVLLDTAAGIGSSVLWFNSFAARNIVVVTPDPTSLTDAYALIKVLSRDYGLDSFFLLINQAASEQEGRQTYETLSRVAKQFLNLDTTFLGAIPLDKAVTRAVREQSPFILAAPQSKAAQALFQVAARVAGL